MPASREPAKPERKSRRQDTMPGGMLWIVVLLLLGVVLLITFFPTGTTLDYSEFVKLVADKKVAKVTFSESANSLTAEFDKTVEDALPDDLRGKIRNHRAEVILWKGDVDSGELSKLLQTHGVPRKTERHFTSWLGPLSVF
ncbi:MAG: ATP-dependent metallopeptidase FtsH/Yme1/Tma family protein, partial [Planctomycetes bacterium]|nr:ATP-dependent metallopeptidase FtsH/Yme1/Tma family protein [Planctomycetota bacterium]